jgi:hypothetical protein
MSGGRQGEEFLRCNVAFGAVRCRCNNNANNTTTIQVLAHSTSSSMGYSRMCSAGLRRNSSKGRSWHRGSSLACSMNAATFLQIEAQRQRKPVTYQSSIGLLGSQHAPRTHAHTCSVAAVRALQRHFRDSRNTECTFQCSPTTHTNEPSSIVSYKRSTRYVSHIPTTETTIRRAIRQDRDREAATDRPRALR